MLSDAGSTRGPTRFRRGRILAVAFVLGLGIAASPQSALAGVDGAREANGPSALAADLRSSGVIVVAEKDHDGDKNGNKNSRNNNDNNSSNNNNKNWNKNGNNNWSKSNNKNWNNNTNWSHNNKNWNNNNNNWHKNWSHYNNNWNKDWNNRTYVRGWSRRPYYGDFIGGVILGSIIASNGVGIVPLAPQPDLCWYWADPYMYRGYWDYCY